MQDVLTHLQRCVPRFIETRYPTEEDLPVYENEVLSYQLMADLSRWLLSLSPRRDEAELRAAFACIDELAASPESALWTLVELELVRDIEWSDSYRNLMGPALLRRIPSGHTCS